MKAGIAQRNITASVGSRLTDHTRHSTGVHDPLFVKVLILEKGTTTVAIVCLDIAVADFAFCDRVRETIRKQTGIEHTFINTTHTHSAPWAILEIQPGFTDDDEPFERDWLENLMKVIPEAVAEAKGKLMPVTLSKGRAPAIVGFNRRIERNGEVIMDDNVRGDVVPWVDVLVIKAEDKPLAVLFEHACHAVIVHKASSLTGRDYPGYAVQRINEELGDDVLAMFAQGCGANINGYPLQGGYEHAEKAGRNLGNSVLIAINSARPIKGDKLNVRSTRVMLPCQDPPRVEVCDEMIGKLTNQKDEHVDKNRLKMNILRDIAKRAEKRELRFDINAVSLGREWCLITMTHEMFCQYQLWIDENAPFDMTMVFGYTNGCESYVATEVALSLGTRGGYEAGSYPSLWPAAYLYQIGLPLSLKIEGMIKEGIASVWP